MAIDRIFVAGAGLMGHGIAQAAAAIGKRVVLYEPDASRARSGRERIAGNLERAVSKGRLYTMLQENGTDDRAQGPPPACESIVCLDAKGVRSRTAFEVSEATWKAFLAVLVQTALTAAAAGE